jgi:hypothetical protein
MVKFRFFYIFLCLLQAPFFSLQAQNHADRVKALNEYIDYSNESIHGMLIAHRLFENYNQDVNHYVDLPGHQLNFYNNNDLPRDIFEDPDHWFYETSPRELFDRAAENNRNLDQDNYAELQKIASEIQQTTLRANELRLSIADSINNLDLNNRDALYTVYDMLEAAVDAFDLLQAQLLVLENQTKKILEKGSFPESAQKFPVLSTLMDEIHASAYALLQAVKKEDKASIKAEVVTLKKVKDRFEAYSLKKEGGYAAAIYIAARNNILKNIAELLQSTEDYMQQKAIPEEYALYGDAYYYFNTQMVNKINRYGNGLVPAINDIIDIQGLNRIHKLEIPHYLVIIYPNKVEKKIPVIRSDIEEIAEAPVSLENRSVIMSDKKHQILVDDINPTLEIFDHMKQDGDIISLYYNGTWIFENLSLERKPKKFILQLNEKGKNYLILHAINEGSVPPNTIGINYTHKGRKKRYIMQSNLMTSQMVEIKLDK